MNSCRVVRTYERRAYDTCFKRKLSSLINVFANIVFYFIAKKKKRIKFNQYKSLQYKNIHL